MSVFTSTEAKRSPGAASVPCFDQKSPTSPRAMTEFNEFSFHRMFSPSASTCLPSPEFERQCSYGTDTFSLDAPHYDGNMRFEEVFDWDHQKKQLLIPPESALLEGDNQHVSQKLQPDSDGKVGEELDADGATWVVHNVGPHAEEEEKESRTEIRLQKLENSFDEVRALYEQRYGRSVDDADVDEDGAQWLHFVGSAAMTQPALCMQKLNKLEDQLWHVKSLFKEKYGADVYDEVIQDGMSYDGKIQLLETSLSGVKSLYEQKYGHSVNVIDEDGAVWSTIGASEPQDEYERKIHGLQAKVAEIKTLYNDKFSYEEKVEVLNDSVSDVKQHFARKYGCCTENIDHDGAFWMKTEDITEPQDANGLRLSGLESRLVEVKTLFDQKYGHDEKVESLEDSMNQAKLLFEQKYGYSIDDEMDNDGVLYLQAKGDLELNDECDPRLGDLEAKLVQVKALYDKKYGYGEKMEVLKDAVSNVKQLFVHKYGCCVDDVDDDGALWMNIGENPELHEPQDAYGRRLSGLESRLAEAKALFDQKYGHDEKVELLEDDLKQVRLLFDQKYGYSIDDEMDDEGTLYIQTVSRQEPNDVYDPRLGDMEAKLVEVKNLYDKKYGYDEKVESLEESVNDVKFLFEQKHGYCVVDDMDDNGTLCIHTKGEFEQEDTYDVNLKTLELMLAEVETRYAKKYSYDEKLEVLEASVSDVKLFTEQKYGCSINDVDDDGAQWTCKAAETPEVLCGSNGDRLASLLSKLGDVETLYCKKYGVLDDGEEEDEQDATWTNTTGRDM